MDLIERLCRSQALLASAQLRQLPVAVDIQQHMPAKESADSVTAIWVWEQDGSELIDLNRERDTPILTRIQKIPMTGRSGSIKL